MPAENPFAFRRIDPAAPLGVRLDQATSVLGRAGSEGFAQTGLGALFGGVDPAQAGSAARMLVLDEASRLAQQGVPPDEILPRLLQSESFRRVAETPGFSAQDILQATSAIAKGVSNPTAARRGEFQTMGLNPFAAAVDQATDVVGFEGRTPEVANSELGAPTENPAVDAAGKRLTDARKVYQELAGMLPNISSDKGFETFGRLLDRQLKAAGLPTLAEEAKADPFTLSPGQTRFGPDGKPIANVEAKPEAPPEIVRLLDQADQARAAGQARRAAIFERRAESLAGKTIDQIRDEARAAAEGKAAAGGTGTRAQKIANLTAQGLSEADAANVVDGHVRFEIVPQTGMARLVDQIKGTVREVPISGAGTPTGSDAPAPRAAGRVPVLSDVSRFGGLAPIGEKVQKFTFGLLGDNEERNAQRQRYRLLRETVVEAFQRSGRPSNFAQQRVEELLPSSGVFESPEGAHDQLSTMYEVLQANMEDDQQIADDPNMPQGERAEAKGRVLKARRALEMIGDPAKFPRVGAASVPPPEARVVGQTYVTPRGQAIWRGDGWELVTPNAPPAQ